ncbi:hypothetical protein ACR9GP_22715 [Enterobacter ludwigii]
MKSPVIVDGDTVQFNPQFGPRIIAVLLTTIPGRGHATVGMKKVCIAGDEENVKLVTSYTSGNYLNGTAEVTINPLNTGHLTNDIVSRSGMILQGQQPFDAKFKVTVPAINPANGTPDPGPTTSDGKGMFIASQTWVNAG